MHEDEKDKDMVIEDVQSFHRGLCRKMSKEAAEVCADGLGRRRT